MSERFKFYNVINGIELSRIITARNRIQGNEHTVDHTLELGRLLGIDLYEYETLMLKEILGNINHKSKRLMNMIFKNNLNYCPECLKYAYHSYFHQLICLKTCPFHNLSLITSCPKCKRSIKYKSGYSITKAYECSCGFTLVETLLLNRVAKTRIIDTEINQWMNSPLKNHSNILIFPMFGYVNINIINAYTNQIIYEKKNRIISKEVRSLIYVFQSKSNSIVKPSEDILLKNIYKSTLTGYSNLNRQIRINFTNKERGEIKRIIKNHFNKNVKLSYIQYLKWRTICENLYSYSQIDNGIRRKEVPYSVVKTAAKSFDPVINDIYNTLVKENVSYEVIEKIITTSFGIMCLFSYKEIKHVLRDRDIDQLSLDSLISVTLIINNENNTISLLVNSPSSKK